MDFAGREQILCLGDSITEQGWGTKGGVGWLALLSNAYRRRADVLSRGYGGYTTRTLSPIALHLLAHPPPARRYLLVIVYIGSNDLNGQPEQHVPLAEYRQRLQALLAAAAGVAQCVLCLGPGPMDDRRWPHRSNAASAAYNDAAREACADARSSAGGATPILFASLLAGAPPEGSALGASRDPIPWLDLLSDGLHLSCTGNAELAALVLRTLAEQCPSVAPEALPWDFPAWHAIQVDAQDAAAAAFTPEALAAFRQS